MTNKPKRRYRIRNWPDYNSALVRRGSLTLWVEQGAVHQRRDTAAPARRGRRRTYSDLAITCALTLREVYHLPLRSTRGLARSALRLLGADSPAPHYSTLSRRAAALEVRLPRLSRGPLHPAVDSTGVKLYGEGGWKVRLHGKEKRRTWRDLHLLLDHRTQEAVGPAMTDKDALDRRESPGLLEGGKGRGGGSPRRRGLRLPGLLQGHPRAGRALRDPAAGAGAGQERAGVPRPERGRRTRAGGWER